MKKLIIIVDKEFYEFDELEELKEFLVPNYNSLSQDDIEKLLYENIFGFSMMNNLQIVSTQHGVYGSNYEISDEKIQYERAIIIDNIDTYILSLCKFGAITLLEEKSNRTYTTKIDKNFNEDNYINVNAFVSEILLDMVGEIK